MKKLIEYNRRYPFTIIALFVFNLILKISFLGSEPFWYDESISIKTALLDFGHVKHQSDWDNNPPFYYYCLWVWLKLFGISEFKARLLSVLFNCVSVVLVFSLAKKHFNYLTGLTAALLFSVHSFSYQYTHEARSYSLVVMLILISTYVFIRFIDSPTYTMAILLGFTDFLVVYTHYIAGLALVFQFIILCFRSKKLIRLFLISIVICSILVLLRFTKKQFMLILFSYDNGAETFWLKKADLNSLKITLVNLFGGQFVWIPLILLFFGGALFYFTKKKSLQQDQRVLLQSSLLTGGAVIPVLFILGLYKPLFLDRYLLFTVPFICITVSWFLCNSFKIAFAAIPVIIALEIMALELNPSKNMDFRTASEVVTNLRKSTNGTILIQTRDVTGLFAYYYDRDLFMDQKTMIDNLKKKKILELENANELKAINPFAEETLIFCQSFDKTEDSNQIFDIFKQNNYVFVSTNAVKGVRISLLKKIRSI